jgi:hypothetical protein
MIEADQRTAQKQERLVDVVTSFITDRQLPVLRYPSQRTLYNPPVPTSFSLLSTFFLAMRLLMPRFLSAHEYFMSS